MKLGTEVAKELLENYFIVGEGEGNILIGKIRSGKTYGATAMIWDNLLAGKTVYATWPIQTKHVDDRDDWLFLLRGILLPWKKYYFEIPTTENFHYINAVTGEVDGIPTFKPTTQGYIAYLNSLNHCTIYIDEAWRILNHTLVYKSDMEDVFNLILVTGHKFRTVNVIAQRLVGINPTFRDNANRVYRFTKFKVPLLGFTLFKREEFQDWQGDFISPDQEPEAVITYWGKKRIFDSYNSWYYGEEKPLHDLQFRAWELKYHERLIGIGLVLYRIFVSTSSLFFRIYKKSLGREIGNRTNQV